MKKQINCGRPAGRKKTSKIEVSIEPEVKEKFMKLVRSEGNTASVQIGQWIREYIRNNTLEDHNI